jgi:hypothetical protein
MAPMGRSPLALLLALPLGVFVLSGCSATRPEWLKEEDDACFRPRSFTEEIPQMYWGDPVRDPCWRFRRVVPDR